MRTETYLNAYFAVRDRLERHHLEGRVRWRLVRQERKLEARLRQHAREYAALQDLYKECHKERVFLWVGWICQMVFLVGLAIAKVL